MQRETLLKAIIGISDKLYYKGEHGVITLHGDSALLLLKKIDKAEKLEAIIDVDIPRNECEEVLAKVGKRLHLRKDWVDKGIRFKLSRNNRRIYYTEITALTVYYTDIEYILAMKMIYGDKKDIVTINRLMKENEIHRQSQLITHIGRYYEIEQVNKDLLNRLKYS